MNLKNIRICRKCGIERECRNGHATCKTCEIEYGRKRYISHKEFFVSYREVNRDKYRKLNNDRCKRIRAERHILIDRIKNKRCHDCGIFYPPFVMDFDHRDPSTKKYEIHDLFYTLCPTSRLLSEIDKCDVVCVCCHRLRTFSKKTTRKLSNRRKILFEQKTNKPCLDCNKMFFPYQMDFDHVRGEKIKIVSHCTKNKILDEIAKCELVCANCHRIRTQARNPTKRMDISLVPNKPIRSNIRHTVRAWHILAGTMTDKEISEKFKISKSTVCLYRIKMKITAFAKNRISNVDEIKMLMDKDFENEVSDASY